MGKPLRGGGKLAKDRTHSGKTKTFISRALAGVNNPFYTKNHSVVYKVAKNDTS